MPTTTGRPGTWMGRLLLGTAGVLALIGANVLLGAGLDAAAVQLPSSVASMILLFGGLLLCQVTAPIAVSRVMELFRPASGFLQRWMGLFFVPPLVVLPMEELPAGAEMWKMLLILVSGGLFTLITSAYLLRHLSQSDLSRSASTASSGERSAHGGLFLVWLVIAGTTVTLAQFAEWQLLDAAFLLAITVAGYVLGLVLQNRASRYTVRPVVRRTLIAAVHPVMISAVAAASVLWLTELSPQEYMFATDGYPGAGEVLMALLDPAFISLGFLLFVKREILLRYVSPLSIAITLAAFLSLFVTAVGARMVALEEIFALATLSRSVTTPVAIPMANVLGASPGLTAAFVVLTGVFGAVVGPPVLRSLGFTSPIVRGMAIGASAHGIGTAALVMDGKPTAAAVSAVTFVLMAAISALFVSLGPVREVLWLLIAHPAG